MVLLLAVVGFSVVPQVCEVLCMQGRDTALNQGTAEHFSFYFLISLEAFSFFFELDTCFAQVMMKVPNLASIFALVKSVCGHST